MIEYFGNLSQYLGLPINSDSHGLMIDNMIGWVHWVMLILFVGWGIYLIIAVIKFSEKANPCSRSYSKINFCRSRTIFSIEFA